MCMVQCLYNLRKNINIVCKLIWSWVKSKQRIVIRTVNKLCLLEILVHIANISPTIWRFNNKKGKKYAYKIYHKLGEILFQMSNALKTLATVQTSCTQQLI